MKFDRGPAALAALLLTLGASAAFAQTPRAVLPPGETTNEAPKAPAFGVVAALTTTDMTTLTPLDLVQALLGPGVVASNITLTGAPNAAGLFAGGFSSVGVVDGVILSSGNVGSILGPNALDWTSTDNQRPGDADLDALTTTSTHDACILEFDFTVTGPSQISFQYVFSSEEYNEWVNSPFNDVFGFFLNGQNIALLPSGDPVEINNVNCGNPYVAGGGVNCGLYVNNSCADLPGGSFPCPGAFNTEMDGMTVVLTASGTTVAGVNHIRLAIADAGDSVYDSNVFIRGGSFTPGPPGPFFPDAPCDEILYATVGLPLTYAYSAQASTGEPNNAVTLSVGAFPAGMTHNPPLPLTVAGQNVTATTNVSWVPTGAQFGTYQITYTATDQEGESEDCPVTIVVADAILILGVEPTNAVVAGTNGRILLTWPLYFYRISEQVVPQWTIPNDPALFGLHFYTQVGMYDPATYPTDPFRVSNAVDAVLGVGSTTYGEDNDGLLLWLAAPPLLGTVTELKFNVDV